MIVSEKKVGIRAVARLARVSASLASAVLRNDLGEAETNVRFNEDTAVRVREAAERLGYIPNRMAHAMLQKKSLTIGIMLPWPEHEKYSHMFRLVSEALRGRGYHVIPSECSFGQADIEHRLRELVSLRVGGVVFLPMVSEYVDKERVLNQIRSFKKICPSIVVADWYWDTLPLDCVDILEDKLMELPLRHLLENGHREIAAIGMHSARREEVIRDIYQQFGLNEKVEEVVGTMAMEAKQDFEQGYANAVKALKVNPNLTALLCNQDRVAIGAYRACEQLGRRVGKDIAITGGDNTKMGEFLPVSLTTIDVCSELVVDSLVELIVGRIEGTITCPHIRRVVEPKLIIRESSHVDANLLQRQLS